MADDGIGWKWVGLDAFNALISRVRDLLKGPFTREAGRQIRDAYIDRIGTAFATRGGSVGGWAPLSPPYAAWKGTHYPARPLLIRTGEMQQALTRPNNPDFIYDRRDTSVTLGAKDGVSAHHQDGDGVPQRTIFRNDTAWGEEVAHIVSDSWFGGSIERVLRVV